MNLFHITKINYRRHKAGYICIGLLILACILFNGVLTLRLSSSHDGLATIDHIMSQFKSPYINAYFDNYDDAMDRLDSPGVYVSDAEFEAFRFAFNTLVVLAGVFMLSMSNGKNTFAFSHLFSPRHCLRKRGTALGLSKTFTFSHLFSPRHSSNKFGSALGLSQTLKKSEQILYTGLTLLIYSLVLCGLAYWRGQVSILLRSGGAATADVICPLSNLFLQEVVFVILDSCFILFFYGMSKLIVRVFENNRTAEWILLIVLSSLIIILGFGADTTVVCAVLLIVLYVILKYVTRFQKYRLAKWILVVPALMMMTGISVLFLMILFIVSYYI